MKNPVFTGSAVALVTPFTASGEVNYDKLSELIEFHIENHSDALVICGTTGESSTMSEETHMEVLKFCADKAKGRISMIAGTGSNDTKAALLISKYAEEVGYDALLVVTPYYNKATQKGLRMHFGAIADAVNIPIILYHIPGRTGVKISLDTFKYLDKNYANITAVKEATGDVAFAAKLKAETDLVIYAGNDDIIVPIMSIGGKGVISVVANILPKETHDICADFENGQIEKSRNDFLKMLDLINTLFIEVNPTPIKTAMNLLGYEVGGFRLPLCDMEDENLAILKKSLENYGLKLK